MSGPDDQYRRAELFAKLADRASERFESRRKMEWTTNIALWTALGAGALALITSSAIRLPTWGAWLVSAVATLGVVALFGIYWRMWIPYLNNSFQRESKTAYYWETYVQKLLIGLPLPKPLRSDDGTWPSAFDETGDDSTNEERQKRLAEREEADNGTVIQTRLNESQFTQIFVTFVFAAFFIATVWIKSFEGPTAVGEVGISPPLTEFSEWGQFDGRVVASWNDDGRNMTLAEDFGYIDPRGMRWDAKGGAVVNGASIPRPFWSVIGGPFEGKFRNASVVHDVYCESKAAKWEDVHRMFYEACRCGGVDERKAKAMYYAVHNFGPRWRTVSETKMLDGGPPEIVHRLVTEDPPDPPEEEAEAIMRYFEKNNPDLETIPELEIPSSS